MSDRAHDDHFVGDEGGAKTVAEPSGGSAQGRGASSSWEAIGWPTPRSVPSRPEARASSAWSTRGILKSSARILLLGLVGFLAVLVLETTVTAVALGVPLVEASTSRRR